MCKCVSEKIQGKVGFVLVVRVPCAECDAHQKAGQLAYKIETNNAQLIADELDKMARERLALRGIVLSSATGG